MSLVLGNISALEFWRDNACGSSPRINASTRATSSAKSALDRHRSWKQVDCKSILRGFSTPAHVLVRSAQERTDSKIISPHVWAGPIPPRSFARISPGLYTSSPEFTFAQLANELSLIELIYLAYELCGTYPSSFGPASDKPLTSTRKLLGFLEQCPGVSGRNKAMRAVSFAMDNSASPMESITAMLLCLPYRLGGYGLPAPLLNYRIDIPARYRAKASKSHFKCDLYWPQAKTAVEYDSDMHHTAAAKITEDAIRRNDLEAIGISVMTVTARQIFDGHRLNTLAHALAKPLGRQLRYKDPDFSRKNIELREQLSTLLRSGRNPSRPIGPALNVPHG